MIIIIVLSSLQAVQAGQDTVARKLISTAGSNPTWSTDSSEIAYGHDDDGGIVIVNVKTLKQRKLTSSGKDPAWSPNNLWIAYVSPVDGNIYVQQLAGKQPVLKIAQGIYPQWFSTTSELLYADSKSRSLEAVMLSSGSTGLSVVKTRTVTKLADPFTVISPDGESMAFMMKDGLKVGPLNNPNQSRIVFPTKGERGFLMDWSPDGSKLVVGGFLGSQLGLWIVDTEGSKPPKPLVPAGVKPAWSPNGKWIAFDRSAAKDPGIEIIEVSE